MLDLTFTEFDVLFRAGMEKNGLAALCTEKTVSDFFRLTQLLLEKNDVMNLTAITDPAEIIVKHYADCAKLLPYLPENIRMADIGTGAGFPSLPIAILRPDVRVLAVDSTQKKLDHVGSCAQELGLPNLSVLCARAEDLGQDPVYREKFSFVTARAVARMNVLSEWCLPLVSVGGTFLAMKGKNAGEEVSEASHGIALLGGSVSACFDETLFPIAGGEASSRGTVIIRKEKQTPKQFPRPNAKIRRSPL